MDCIRIERLRAHGIIGLNEWERKQTQDVLITLALYLDLREVATADGIEKGVNYSEVCRRVLAHVQASERFTLETLATDVAGICLSFPPVDRVAVRVSKPAVDKHAEAIAVEIERDRPSLTTSALIGLGSNVSASTNLSHAVERLGRVGKVIATSSVYESPGADHPQQTYLNAVAKVETVLPAAEIQRQLKLIEIGMGRTADSKPAGHIPIDLDLCLLGRQVIRAKDVSVPDPDILCREYLARGCAELMPDAIYPETNEPLAEIAKRLTGSTPSLRVRSDLSLS
jgi:2-amino-4-hydroxy-6-hydroxymethyldihydropteridine diphosphokinase